MADRKRRYRQSEEAMTGNQLIDELTYINYRHNRRLSPHITPERWAKSYDNARAMEARYQLEPIDTHAEIARAVDQGLDKQEVFS